MVTFKDPVENKVVVLKAKKVEDSSLGLSFISISDFIFETNSILVNPASDKLKEKFKNTKSLHLSLYSIISITEEGQEHLGLAFDQDKSKLLTIPTGPSQ